MSEPLGVAVWKGVPVHQLSRDDLHEAFCAVLKERDDAWEENRRQSQRYIRSLAAGRPYSWTEMAVSLPAEVAPELERAEALMRRDMARNLWGEK